MAAPLSVDCPPLPAPSGEVRSPKARPESERKRLRLDSLAIGAPLTAAFIGGLLADGQMVAADVTVAGATEEAATVRRGDTPESTDGSAPGAVIPGVEEATESVSDDTALGSKSTFDPVTASGTGAGAASAGGTAVGSPTLPLAEATAVNGGSGESGGSVQVNLTLGTGPGVDLEVLGGPVEGAPSGLDPIGTFVAGSEGDDAIVGTELADQLIGGAGDDQIQGLAGNDLLDGGGGDDQLSGGTGDDLLLGGTGNDQLRGGADDDALLGGSGDDLLFGNGGVDRLEGGAGNDRLDGGAGNDQLRGGTGDDLLIVDGLHDVARENGRGFDGGGIDILQVEDGFAAELPAGTNSATFVFSDNIGGDLPSGINAYRQQVSPDIEHVTLNGSANHDVVGDGLNNELRGNAGDNALFGGAGDDLLDGGAGSDRLDGGAGGDLLNGGAGGDSLVGGSGADVLQGGDGDDILAGDRGADLLYGEAGNDTFVIGLNDSAVDTIFDHSGNNVVALDGVTDHTVEAAIIGDDLHLIVDKNPIGIVDDYVGHEDAIAGVRFGGELFAVDDLLASVGPASGAAVPDPAPAVTDPVDQDVLASYLDRPSHQGTGADDSFDGTNGADWLTGLAGDDHLQGRAGDDVLEGGDGTDLLEGGAGDDRYLFTSGEAGIDTIRDAEGSNVAELQGFTGAKLQGVVVGGDLFVVADYGHVFTVENHAGNEAAFAGVQVDDTFIPTEDLFG